MTETIEKSIEVNAPVRDVYNQWTQFEQFPHFMNGVKEVRQIDDKTLHWHAEIMGITKQWKAEIDDQIPDKRVAWHSVEGAEHAGVVTFHYLDDNKTRVMLQMKYDPEGFVENAGDFLGIVSRQVEGDLQRFKDFIESRDEPTGAWRGEIHGEKVQD